MKQLHNQSRIPYGGIYVLDEPTKALVGRGTTFVALVKSCSEWRRANSVPIGIGFESEVEAAVCEKYSVECDDDSVPQKPRRGRLTLATVLRGTKVLLAFKMAGSPYVDHAEAERRASICAACPQNIEYAKPCGGNCGGLKEVVTAIVGGHKTSFDSKLKACGICQCINSAHIWMPLEILSKGITDGQRVQFSAVQNCWKKDV